MNTQYVLVFVGQTPPYGDTREHQRCLERIQRGTAPHPPTELMFKGPKV